MRVSKEVISRRTMEKSSFGRAVKEGAAMPINSVWVDMRRVFWEIERKSDKKYIDLNIGRELRNLKFFFRLSHGSFATEGSPFLVNSLESCDVANDSYCHTTKTLLDFYLIMNIMTLVLSNAVSWVTLLSRSRRLVR